MYSIKQTKNPPLVKPLKMTCDDPLHPGIPYPLPNRGGARFLIVGSPGSGKTNWAVSQLIRGGAYHRVFDALHVVMPLNSRASFAKDPFENHNKNYRPPRTRTGARPAARGAGCLGSKKYRQAGIYETPHITASLSI